MDEGSAAERNWVVALRDPNLSAEAATELGRRLRAALGRSFSRQLAESDLDDVTQDALARVLAKLDTFRGESRFLTWATAIAVRTALGEIRRRKHGDRALARIRADGQAAVERALAPQTLQHDDARAVLRRAIDAALSDAQRDALYAEMGGLSLMEIARRTGRSRGALYKLLHDARKKLRAHLEAAGVGPQDLLDGEGP